MPYGREGSWSQCAPVTEEETSQSAKRVSAESPAHRARGRTGRRAVQRGHAGSNGGAHRRGFGPAAGGPRREAATLHIFVSFCAPACSSSATPTHDVEVRDETEGLEEGAAAQRVDGGIGLDVLATQGW